MAIFGSKDFVKARGGKKQKDFVGTILGEILGSDCNFHQTLWGGEGVHICRVMVCSPCILPTHNMPWWKPCRENHVKTNRCSPSTFFMVSDWCSMCELVEIHIPPPHRCFNAWQRIGHVVGSQWLLQSIAHFLSKNDTAIKNKLVKLMVIRYDSLN